MFSFMKRLFGGGTTTKVSSDPFSRDIPASDEIRTVPPARQSPPMVLQRDEMLDANTRIVGYRFAGRLPEGGCPAGTKATIDLLASHNVADFAQRRVALIPTAADDWFAHDHRSLVGPNTIFLLAPPAESTQEAWADAASQIRASGAGVAVALGGLTDDQMMTIAGQVNLALIDFTSYSLVNFEAAINKLNGLAPGVGLIVDNVSRWAEFRYCIAHGARYCLGPFTREADEAQQDQEIGQSRLVLIDMLNQLRKEADLQDVAEVAKRDPGVVVKIIGMANSPMAGLNQPVTSVDQAILMLGRNQLYRWLAIGMFRAGNASPRDEVLLELALARGRFLEVLGQDKHSKLECDEFFLLGLLSLLDSLLGVPMAKVVDKINLSPALKDVLLTSGGPLGRYLLLAIAVEKGHADNVVRLAETLAYPLEAVEAASAEAIGWADEAVRMTG